MKRIFLLTLLFSTALLCSTSRACSVPVFRYALENWRADPYVVTVFHRGPLTAEQQELLSVLKPVNEDGFPIANIFVRAVDLNDDLGEATQAVWDQHPSEVLPHVVVQVPGKFGAPASDVWSGPLNDDNVQALMNSPVREAVEKKMLEGTSVLWLFLESGDKEKDDAAFELLTKELQRLQLSLQLPEIDPADFSELSVAPEALKLEFSALRVPRDDPKERMLVEMLLSVEPDLRDEQFVHQAMAFPVFGRGRALYALVGNGIQQATIEDANRFLVSACQCTVKAQNPGVDLLLPVEWDRYVEPALEMETSLPPLTGLGGFVGEESGTLADESPSTGEEPAADDEVAVNDAEEPEEVAVRTDGVETESATADEVAPVPNPHDPATLASTDALVAHEPAASDSEDSSILRNTMVVIGLLIAAVVMASVLVMRRH
jgi:hypothetical protein